MDAVTRALDAGVRAFDSAQAYGNEAALGRAVAAWLDKRSGGDAARRAALRGELFLATKVSDLADYGRANVRALVDRQLRALRVAYVDLYYLPVGILFAAPH